MGYSSSRPKLKIREFSPDRKTKQSKKMQLLFVRDLVTFYCRPFFMLSLSMRTPSFSTTLGRPRKFSTEGYFTGAWMNNPVRNLRVGLKKEIIFVT